MRLSLAAFVILLSPPAFADGRALFYEPPNYSYEAPTYQYEAPRVAPRRDPAEALPPSQAWVERCTTRFAGYDVETNSTLDDAGNRVPCAVEAQGAPE